MELFFCENTLLGFLLIAGTVFFYLYLLHYKSFLIHYRILLLFSYLSFRVLLDRSFIENHKSALPNCAKFCIIKRKLKQEHIVAGGFIYSLFYTMILLLLYYWKFL